MLYMGHTLVQNVVQNVVIYRNQICGTQFCETWRICSVWSTVLYCMGGSGRKKNPWVWISGAVNQSVPRKNMAALSSLAPSALRSLVSRYAIVYLRYKSTPSQRLQPHFYPLVASNVPGSGMCMAIGYSLSSFVDFIVLYSIQE